MSEILKIKIDRKVAGFKIPYDVIYLVPRDQRGLIPRLWDFALVMPFEESFKDIIYKLNVSKISYLKQHRDDDKLGLNIVDNAPQPKKSKENQLTAAWEDLKNKYTLDDRLVVVPILMSKRDGNYRPRYITSKQWFIRLISTTRRERQSNKAKSRNALFKEIMTRTEVSKFVPGVSDLAYMTTPFAAPDDVVRPLCGICPRNMQHLQGQCIPGMQICYETLDFNLTPKTNLLPASTETV